MKRPDRFCIALVLINLSCLVFSQDKELRFNHFGIDEGLSNGIVTSIVEDERGYLWVGTKDGLNRFDGQEFKVFRTQRDRNSICGNNISMLAKDSSGVIWVGTLDGGLCSLDPEAIRFHTYDVREQYPAITQKVMSMAVESPKRIHVGFEKAERLVLHVDEEKYISQGGEVALNQTDYAMYYSQRSARLYHSPIHAGMPYEDSTGSHATNLSLDTQVVVSTHQFPGYTMNEMIEDEQGVIWAGAWDNALHSYDPVTGEMTYHTLDGGEIDYTGNEIISLEPDMDGTLWLGTRSEGLYRFEPISRIMSKIQNAPNDPGGMRGTTVEALFRDSHGRMWIGSEDGLTVHDPLLNQIEVYTLSGLDEVLINEIRHFDSTLLLGHSNGITMFSEGVREDIALHHEGKKLTITDFHVNKSGHLLVGTDKSVYEWSPEHRQLKLVPKLLNPDLDQYRDISASFVSDIVDYQVDNRLFTLAYFFGYDLLVMSGDDHHATPNHVGWLDTYENLVRGLRVDSKNRLWALGSSKGLILIDDLFDPDSIRKADRPLNEGGHRYCLSAETFVNAGDSSHRLTSMDVTDMIERDDGKFWVSTLGAGLFLFDPEVATTTFTNMDCPINSLLSMAMDKSGGLWIPTGSGLLHYDPVNDRYKLYDKMHGLPYPGLRGEIHTGPDGFIYVGGEGFFIRLHPDSIEINQVVAGVHLDRVEVNGNVHPTFRIDSRLNYDENFLTFHLSSPNLTDATKNTYAFRLKGLEDRWRESVGPIVIQYTSLPAGDYELLVKVANNDRIWSDVQEVASFVILPPWWRRWYFYLSICSMVAALLYLLHRYRMNQLKRLYEVRNTIARDLHDDLGATLGSISMYSQVVKSQLDESDQAKAVVEIIGETSRGMLDKVGDIVWAVNPKNDLPEQLLERMQDFAGPLLREQGIQLDFVVSGDAAKNKLSMVERKNLFLIFKEAIHNVLKYANAKNVTVHLKVGRDGKYLQVKDDGSGFDPTAVQAYNGNGMMNMRNRAESMGGVFLVDSRPGGGCKIEVRVN